MPSKPNNIIDTKLALSIGGEFNPDKISLEHWGRMAHDCNVRVQYLKKMIQDLSETLLAKISTTEDEFETTFGSYPALQRIKKFVNKQCKGILKQFLQGPDH